MKTKKIISVILVLTLCILALSGCQKSVSNYDYTTEYNKKTYSGTFTGKIRSKKPVDGKGKFNCKDGDFSLDYDGEWKDGKMSGKGTMTVSEIEITYDNKKFTGEYSGEVKNFLPNGQGTFKSNDENDDKLEYSGQWTSGKFSGKGNMTYSAYVIEYTDGTSDDPGTYKGETINGLPSGQGEYKSKNSDGKTYTYNGLWKNGKFNGQGTKTYDDRKMGVRAGNYKDNSFEPNIVDLVQAMGTFKDDCEYTLSDKQKEFIKTNEKAFISHKMNDIKPNLNKSFNLKSFKKKPDNFKPAFVKVTNLYVGQIMEYKIFGYKDVTLMLAGNIDTNDVYYVYMLGSAKGIVENSKITMYMMPIDYTTYKNVSDDEVWAVAGMAVKIDKVR